MTIGGEAVEVWGMTYAIDLRGEQEGRVDAPVFQRLTPFSGRGSRRKFLAPE